MATRRNTVLIDPNPIPDYKLPDDLKTAASPAPQSLYASPIFHGHSLWLCPSAGDDAAFLENVIKETADSLKTEAFLPHLSVVAGINDVLCDGKCGAETNEEKVKCDGRCELINMMDLYQKRLAHNFDDIFVPSMDLHGLGARDLFFQCVYAHPVVTESIAAVNRLACDVFERPGNGCGYEGDYMPHLSLVYGDLDQKTKAKAMEELAKTVIGKAFNFGSLQLWSTEGLHTQWKCVKTVTLPLPYHVSFTPSHTSTPQLSPRTSPPRRLSSKLRSESIYLHEATMKEFQNGTMTRSDIMQWATARKALINAHRAGMRQLRGAREYEEKMEDDTANTIALERQRAREERAREEREANEVHTITKAELEKKALEEAGEADEFDLESKSLKSSFHLARSGSKIKHNERHGVLLKGLRLKNKSTEINKVIQDSIRKSIELGGEDPNAAHPIIDIIANYNFESGIASAGMAWGSISHAVKKLRVARRETTEREPQFMNAGLNTQARLEQHVESGHFDPRAEKPTLAPGRVRPTLQRRTSTGVAVHRNQAEVERGVEM